MSWEWIDGLGTFGDKEIRDMKSQSGQWVIHMNTDISHRDQNIDFDHVII